MGKTLYKRLIKSKGLSLALITIGLIIFFQIMNPSFLSRDNMRGLMNSMSLSGTITVGMACLLMSGAADLSSGAVGCFSGVLVAFLLQAGVPTVPAVVITLLYGLCAGLFNAFLANVLNFMPFIATLAMASVWSGLANATTNSLNVVISNQGFWKLGSTTIGIFPLPFFIMLALMIIYAIIISRTRFGRRLMLCGGNRNAARLAGISSKKITTIMFANNGVIASLAGVVLAARMHLGSPTSVIGSEMDGLTAAIIGGVSFTGGGSSGMGVVFLGLAMLNCFKNGLTVIRLPQYWQIVSQGALLVLALLLDYLRESRRIKSMKAQASKDVIRS